MCVITNYESLMQIFLAGGHPDLAARKAGVPGATIAHELEAGDALVRAVRAVRVGPVAIRAGEQQLGTLVQMPDVGSLSHGACLQLRGADPAEAAQTCDQ